LNFPAKYLTQNTPFALLPASKTASQSNAWESMESVSGEHVKNGYRPPEVAAFESNFPVSLEECLDGYAGY
jgi:hypothetical protein